MRRRFLRKPFFVFTLLATLLLAPAAYAQDQRAAAAAVMQTAAQETSDRQKRVTFESFIRTELYFGRNIPGGREVNRKDFDRFLSEFISPRFPDGLTVLNGRGQFLNSNGEIEREQCIVLILLYPVAVQEEKVCKIEEIREEYKLRFQQQSVLWVDNPTFVRVSF
jgi:hypothetical protein